MRWRKSQVILNVRPSSLNGATKVLVIIQRSFEWRSPFSEYEPGIKMLVHVTVHSSHIFGVVIRKNI